VTMTETTAPAPATAALAGQPAATPPSAPAVDTSWLGTDAKPEISSYVQSKGFKGPAALAEAYINAERALSSRQFEPPKAEDQAGWAKIKAAMGVPEAADKYDLGDAGKALKPEAVKEWGGVFHQLGLSNDQAAKLVGHVTAQAEAQQAQQHEAYVQASEKAAERMKAEMGEKWPAFHDLAMRGFNHVRQALKLTDDKIDALERAIGTREMLALAHLIGESKVEAGFITSDGQQRGLTKDQARAAMTGLKGDPAKYQALITRDHPNHAAVLSEWTQLRRIAEQ